MHGQAVVVGVGESAYYKHGGSPDTEFQLACKASRRAVDDAGLDLSEVDGPTTYMDQRNSPLRLAEALGLKELRWSMTPLAGGGNNSAAVVMCADAAVSAASPTRRAGAWARPARWWAGDSRPPWADLGGPRRP